MSFMFKSCAKKSCVMESIPLVRCPFQLYHRSLSNSVVWLCIMSASRRCGSLLMVHCENSLSRVWWSMILDVNLEASSFVISSCSSKYFRANVADPMGVPSNLNPSVSSIGVVVPSRFCWFEYFAMVLLTSMASSLLVAESDGRMLARPEHEVRILVLCGLMKQPLGDPSFSISEQKNLISW